MDTASTVFLGRLRCHAGSSVLPSVLCLAVATMSCLHTMGAKMNEARSRLASHRFSQFDLSSAKTLSFIFIKKARCTSGLEDLGLIGQPVTSLKNKSLAEIDFVGQLAKDTSIYFLEAAPHSDSTYLVEVVLLSSRQGKVPTTEKVPLYIQTDSQNRIVGCQGTFLTAENLLAEDFVCQKAFGPHSKYTMRTSGCEGSI